MATPQAVKKLASLWRNCGRSQMTLLRREIVYGRCGKLFSVSGNMGLFHVEHSGLTRLLLSPWDLSRRITSADGVPRGTSGRRGQTVPL